jgi:hypothetical protein
VSFAQSGIADGLTRDAGPRVIPILRSGILADDLCRRGGQAEVAAVFERSIYLRAGETFLCIGAPAIGNGPLTLVADLGGAARVPAFGLYAGQTAQMCARHITVGHEVRFSLAGCEAWHPPAWPAASRARFGDACAAVVRRAARQAPADGLARVVFGAEQPDATSFARIARGRIASFESWLAIACGTARLLPLPLKNREREPGRRATCDSPAEDGEGEGSIRCLIGLGPGLTPSGDDFLCGALALLDALAEAKVHATLAQAVVAQAVVRTSPLSACFLHAAAAGHIGEHLHSAVAALISDDIDTAIAVARRIGHSSGWDMLAGAAATLRIVAHTT